MNMHHKPEARFKAGDRVVCNNNEFAKWELDVGKEYVVRDVRGGDLLLEGVTASYMASRFSPVETKPSARFKVGDVLAPVGGPEGDFVRKHWDRSFADEYGPASVFHARLIGDAEIGVSNRPDGGALVHFRASRFALAPSLHTHAIGDTLRVTDNKTKGGYTMPGYPVGYVGKVTQVVSLDGEPHGYILDNKAQFLRAHQVEVAGISLEVGKFYRTRAGHKVGPMARWRDYWHIAVRDKNNNPGHYADDGTSAFCGKLPRHDKSREPFDIVAEWVDDVPQPAKAEPKFKVGDRIRHKRLAYVGGVTRVNSEGNSVRVKWDNGMEATDPFDSVELLVTTPPCIVAMIEHGQPKPATRPFVHPNRDAATKEADRLAGIHKGKDFGVYELVDTRKVEAPKYEHEWQRLAVAGRKIDAIKELRRVADLSLKGAKDAVEHWFSIQ